MSDKPQTTFTWPDWVPAEIRKQIESFYGPSNRRTLDEWVNSPQWKAERHPPFGARVRCLDHWDAVREGRWVPRWNNIGCVVTDSGEVYGASTLTRSRIEILAQAA